jgi:hypothetical protein
MTGYFVKTTAAVAAFAKGGDWTPESIDERQVWLSDLALKRRPLFSGAQQKKKRRGS